MATNDIWNLPPSGIKPQKFDQPPAGEQPPDPNQPYFWFNGKWYLAMSDDADGVPRDLFPTPVKQPTEQEILSTDPPLTQLSPPGYEQHVFLEPKLPERPFLIRYTTDGTEDGPYHAEDFDIEEETNIAYTDGGLGHPVYLRVLSQVDNTIETVDGGGNTYTIELREVPDEYMSGDPFTPQSQQDLQNG
jgi:hypothetical protein